MAEKRLLKMDFDRDYATVVGIANGARYEQDGVLFDGNGIEVVPVSVVPAKKGAVVGGADPALIAENDRLRSALAQREAEIEELKKGMEEAVEAATNYRAEIDRINERLEEEYVRAEELQKQLTAAAAPVVDDESFGVGDPPVKGAN